jgi:hypothetical protein
MFASINLLQFDATHIFLVSKNDQVVINCELRNTDLLCVFKISCRLSRELCTVSRSDFLGVKYTVQVHCP